MVTLAAVAVAVVAAALVAILVVVLVHKMNAGPVVVLGGAMQCMKAHGRFEGRSVASLSSSVTEVMKTKEGSTQGEVATLCISPEVREQSVCTRVCVCVCIVMLNEVCCAGQVDHSVFRQQPYPVLLYRMLYYVGQAVV